MSTGLRDELMMDNRGLWSIGVAGMIRSIGYGATWPFMAIFFNRIMHVPIYFVGAIFALLAVFGTVFQIFGGYLSDFRGRRFTLLLGSSVGIVIYAGIVMLLARGAGPLPLVALFILTSLSGALVFPSANALVVDLTLPQDRRRAYSIFRVMTNTGWAVGPIAGSLIFSYGIIWIFFLVMVTLIAQLFIIFFLVRDRISHSVRASGGMRSRFSSIIVFDRTLAIFSAGTFLLMVLTSQFSVTLPTYAVARTAVLPNQLGYIYAVNGLVVVFGQFPVTAAVSRFREESVLMLGAAFYALGYSLVAFSGSLLQLMADMVLITIGENLTTPSMNSMVSKLAPGDRVGRYMAFNGMANSAGRAAGPTVGSLLLFIYAFNGPLVWSSLDLFGLLSIAIMVYLRISRLPDTRDGAHPYPGSPRR